MTIHSDICIIGGGISGMLTARELLLAGRGVTILDKSLVGQESSWAGGGILLPLYPWRQAKAISALVAESLKIYPKLQQELLQATGIDPEWRDCGLLICKNPDLVAATAWCARYGLACQTAATEQLDGLHTAFEQALWLPEIAQVRNPRLLQSLKAYLQKLGAVFIENSEICNIQIENQRIQKLHTASQAVSLQQLLICTGAWTAGFLRSQLAEINLELPIRPVKGQMLIFEAKPDTLTPIVLDGDRYLIPRRDGRILAGSTVEESDFDKTPDAAAKQQLFDFATGLLPVLKQFPMTRHWAGLRPGTPEGIPFIGRHPTIENLSVNAGHFRNGLVMGPASAQLLADILLERPLAVDPAPYALTTG